MIITYILKKKFIMNKKYEELIYRDIYEIADNPKLFQIIKKKRQTSPYVGLVRCSKNGIIDTVGTVDGFYTNMTIASGREFACQSIFKGFNNSSIFGNISDYKIDAFGIGKGGSQINSDKTYSLLGPSLSDIGLYQPVPINDNCLPSTSNSGEKIEKIVKFVKSEGPGGIAGDIEFLNSDNAEFTSLNEKYYTVAKITCYIDNNEPLTTDTNAVPIDEAMLFATSPNNTNPIPFAHIVFPPKFIEMESVFKIEWYIIC